MPPRYSYWTILAGGLPTAFRAALKEDLLPTFVRIKAIHPDAEMKWFARGKLWDSPEDAIIPRSPAPRRDARDASGGTFRKPGSFPDRPRAPGSAEPRSESRATPHARTEDTGDRRGREWRPGGEHRDPQQPFKDAKKAKNQDRRQQRWDRKNTRGGPAPSTGKPGGSKAPFRPAFKPPFKPRSSEESAQGHRPAGAAQDTDRGRRPAWRPARPFSPENDDRDRRFKGRPAAPPRPTPRDATPRFRSQSLERPPRPNKPWNSPAGPDDRGPKRRP